ncbi:chitin deacetylase, partial [Kappamyces sp. JEL0680]
CGNTAAHQENGQTAFNYQGPSSSSTTTPTSTVSVPVAGAANPTATYAVSTPDVNGDYRCGGLQNKGKGSQCPAGKGIPCCANTYCGGTIESCGITFFGCDSRFGLCSDQSPLNPVPPKGSYPPINTGLKSTLKISCVTPGDFVLGYDDGVAVANDPALLATLKKYGVTAVFFINAYNWNDLAKDANAQKVLKSIVAAGHQIASHTFDHIDLLQLSYDDLYAQTR